MLKNHHVNYLETRDHTGYHRKLDSKELGLEADIIIYADIFSPLSENRPYKKPLSLDAVLL